MPSVFPNSSRVTPSPFRIEASVRPKEEGPLVNFSKSFRARLFTLVLMFCDLLDTDKFNESFLLYFVNRAIMNTQADRPLPLSFAGERLIVITGYLSHPFQAVVFNAFNPVIEFVRDIRRNLSEVL